MTSISFPKVTIAIPTFNRVAFLGGAIESALMQTYPNIEVIVSDNASTDATKELLLRYRDTRLAVLSQARNLGMVQNWNACLERATGEYFLLLPDDDVLEANAIERLVAPYLSCVNPGATGVVYGRTRIVDESMHEVTLCARGEPYERAIHFSINFLRGSRCIYPCSTLFRTHDLTALGGFNEEKYTVACDAGAWMEIILRRGHIACVDEIVSNYRQHTSNLTGATQIDSWISNSRALLGLLLQSIGDEHSSEYRAAKRAGRFFTASVIVGPLYQYSRNARFPLAAFVKGVRKYKKYLSNWQGAYLTARTLVKFISPSLYYRLKNVVQRGRS